LNFIASAQKCGGDLSGHGGPADENGETAGRAADHDVGRGTALEAERVDEDVEQERRVGEGRREPVGEKAQQQGRGDAEDDAGDERLGGLDRRAARALRHQRTAGRAPHDRVDVAVDVAVDRIGAARGERSADEGDQHELERRQAAPGEQHRRERGDQQQFDDSRLGQSEQ
jgi:hypothetical protein